MSRMRMTVVIQSRNVTQTNLLTGSLGKEGSGMFSGVLSLTWCSPRSRPGTGRVLAAP